MKGTARKVLYVFAWIWTGLLGLIGIGALLNRKGEVIGYLVDDGVEIPIYEWRVWFAGFSTAWFPYILFSPKRARQLREALAQYPVLRADCDPSPGADWVCKDEPLSWSLRALIQGLIRLAQHERHHMRWQIRLGPLFLPSYGLDFVGRYVAQKFKWRPAYRAIWYEAQARRFAAAKVAEGQTYIRAP